MTKPVRLQLSRVKGFDLQAHSRAVNGLPAAVVARPTRWGNPYKASPAFESHGVSISAVTVEDAVALYRERMERVLATYPHMRETLVDLRGKNLACWCRPGAPCHADVLLELANRKARAA